MRKGKNITFVSAKTSPRPFCLLLGVFLGLILIGCNDSSEDQDEVTSQKKQSSFVSKTKGSPCSTTTIDSKPCTICSNDSIDEAGLLIFLDPHADMETSKKLYAQMAKEEGFVSMYSGLSKNGLPYLHSKTHVLQLIEHAKTSLGIDANRIYLIGFSGGARAAAQIASEEQSIAGVIGIGASSLANSSNPNFTHVSIIGIEDFNFVEIMQEEGQVANINYDHLLIQHDKGHQWPSTDDLKEALSFIKLREMAKGLTEEHEYWINSELDSDLEEYKSAKDFNQRLQSGQKLITSFDGLSNISTIEIEYDSLITSPGYVKFKNHNWALWYNELNQQRALATALSSKPTVWWRDKLSELKALSKDAKDPLFAQSCTRLLKYLSLATYFKVELAFKQKNPQLIEFYLMIYSEADPGNPDMLFFTAQQSCFLNKVDLALDQLSESIKAGFKDVDKLQNPVWDKVRDDERFKEIVNTLQ